MRFYFKMKSTKTARTFSHGRALAKQAARTEAQISTQTKGQNYIRETTVQISHASCFTAELLVLLFKFFIKSHT